MQSSNASADPTAKPSRASLSHGDRNRREDTKAMAEYTADVVSRLVRRVLFDEWRAQMAAGYLTGAG